MQDLLRQKQTDLLPPNGSTGKDKPEGKKAGLSKQVDPGYTLTPLQSNHAHGDLKVDKIKLEKSAEDVEENPPRIGVSLLGAKAAKNEDLSRKEVSGTEAASTTTTPSMDSPSEQFTVIHLSQTDSVEISNDYVNEVQAGEANDKIENPAPELSRSDSFDVLPEVDVTSSSSAAISDKAVESLKESPSWKVDSNAKANREEPFKSTNGDDKPSSKSKSFLKALEAFEDPKNLSKLKMTKPKEQSVFGGESSQVVDISSYDKGRKEGLSTRQMVKALEDKINQETQETNLLSKAAPLKPPRTFNYIRGPRNLPPEVTPSSGLTETPNEDFFRSKTPSVEPEVEENQVEQFSMEDSEQINRRKGKIRSLGKAARSAMSQGMSKLMPTKPEKRFETLDMGPLKSN